MRLKDDLIKLWNSIDDDLYNKRWVPAILKCLFMSVVGVCMVLCVLGLIMLIYRNIEYVICVVGGIGCLIVFIRSLLPKRQEKNLSKSQTGAEGFMRYDPIALENTYKLLRSNICNVLGEIGDVIKVRKPASYSQMDAPTHYDIVANVPIYHLLVSKIGSEVDTYTMMGILQNTIEKKLNNNEFSGISQAVFFYNGQSYPAIMVENVHDFGSIVQIDVVMANEYYCRYREQRIYNSMNMCDTDNIQDKDF